MHGICINSAWSEVEKISVTPSFLLTTSRGFSALASTTGAFGNTGRAVCSSKLCTELCTSLCQVYPLYSHLVPFLTLHTSQRTPIENDSNQSEPSIGPTP